ncbi:helix-turn-helix domain-containing protein [Methylobacterium sp. 77]|uniref:helix-turn-helix transcriptional regulator n=1 Tax=Methylobacterium sp. 77 TaxID=1101192 RepID=UPI0003712BF1|nr:helix-turn-helix domain-containing protein [Methylobacterium sp. 77]
MDQYAKPEKPNPQGFLPDGYVAYLPTPVATAPLKAVKEGFAPHKPVKPKSKPAPIAFPAEGYATYAQVQARLQISNSTMHLWIQQDRLPAPVRIGARAMRFSVQDILDYERAAREATRVAAE